MSETYYCKHVGRKLTHMEICRECDPEKPVTPEKQEGPQPEEFPNEFGYRKYQEGRRAGRAERDAEVEALKAEVERYRAALEKLSSTHISKGYEAAEIVKNALART